MTFRALSTITLLGVLLTTLSCHSIERFDTKGSAAFCGQLVKAPAFQDGLVPEGQPQFLLSIKLTLDTSQLSSFTEDKSTILGRLSSNDVDLGLCSGSDQPLFKNSPLRGIPQVDHDTISTLSFGEGHDEDFFAWTDSTCQGTMLALVSLLRKGDVELRLFKPAPLPLPGAGPEQRPGFGLFYLTRNDKGCGF